jgi:hypothetical protein
MGPLTNLTKINLPHGKITLYREWEEKGVNDANLQAQTAAQMIASLTNFFYNPISGIPGCELEVLGSWQTWTNASVEAQNSATLAVLLAYDWFCATNKNVVAHYGDAMTLINQNQMDTNRVGASSLEGVHFNNPTNGTPAYAMAFGAWLKPYYGFNPYLTPYLTPQTFPFPGTTVNWTNIYPSPVNVFIDNTGITGTAIKKNGVQYYGSVPSVTLPLNPGEYFSETYTVGTPVGSWLMQ